MTPVSTETQRRQRRDDSPDDGDPHLWRHDDERPGVRTVSRWRPTLAERRRLLLGAEIEASVEDGLVALRVLKPAKARAVAAR